MALHARYEERARPKGLRKKFNTEFEALSGGSFIAGQQIAVVVDSVNVGTIVLVAVGGGDVVGELDFDTNANAHNKKTPFPANFPLVKAGTVVEAKLGGSTVIGCELQ